MEEGFYLSIFGGISIPKDTIWITLKSSVVKKFDHTVEVESGLSLGAAFGRDFGLYRACWRVLFLPSKPTNIIYNQIIKTRSPRSQGSASGDILQYGLLFNNAISISK